MKSDNPVASSLCSVVIPCYQQGEFLDEAISSAFNQTHSLIEVVVVDDGSTDQTGVIARRHPDAIYVYQENAGLAAARNAGIAQSRGEFLVFLDADDRLRPTALEDGIRCFERNPQASFVHGQFALIDRSGADLGVPAWSEGRSGTHEAFLRWESVAMHGSTMFRRKDLERVGGYNADLDVAEDYDLYLKLTQSAPAAGHQQCRCRIPDLRRHDVNQPPEDDGRVPGRFEELSAVNQ